ncbi:unnamed protein product [Vicia faba]|uniref:Integrase zinc-binding domain-containing protein n=1 Tax=Vicia faba TaxID=3906 RepID=A0AAV1A2E8_VICFA|nr:unnamed protein product [Vicia faba]
MKQSSFPFLLQFHYWSPSYYKTDPHGQNLIATVNKDSSLTNKFQLKNDILYYQNKICIPSVQELRQAVLTKFHSTPVAGHLGFQPTLARLSSSFLWPGIYKDVNHLIKHCSVCQQSKYMTKKKQGLLQPLEIPTLV